MDPTEDESEPSGGSEFPLEVYNDLLCPICLEFFKHPIILPCSHVLCRSPCAEHLFDFNFIRCPVCRENCYISGGIGSLPRVIALESIIEKYRSDRRKAVQSASKGQKSHGTSSSGGSNSSLTGACAASPTSDSSEQRHRRKLRSSIPSRYSEDAILTPRNGDALQTPGNSVQAFSQGLQSQTPALLAITSTPRSFDTLDTSVFDVSADSVTSCPRHGSGTSLYCHVCERCVCDMCGDADHATSHETNTLDDAALHVKNTLSQNLDKMTSSQTKVVTALQQQRQRLKEIEQHFTRKYEEINMQCDSLLAEVEHKRSLLLADLEQEERMRQSEVEDVIEVFEKILGASQSLAHYTQDFLEKGTSTVLQVTPALNEQLLGSVLDCEACQIQPDELYTDFTQGKVVDLRKEQTLLRDIHYLNPPGTPSIDVTRCARSDSTVALFLVPPRGSDVIDTYVIRYCSEEQKSVGIEETLTFQNVQTDHLTAGGQSPASLLYVAVLETLLTGTTYLFCATAANRAGHSVNSEVVQCVTLAPRESVVPVPVILETMCKTYTSSIRVFTPSPHDVAPEQSISHFLLYRSRDRKSLWRSVALCGRPEQRVFGLEPETQYEFCVMATNTRGECQMSEKLVLETERSTT